MLNAAKWNAGVGQGCDNSKLCCAKSTIRTFRISCQPAIRSALICLTLLGFALPAHAEEPKFIGESYSLARAAPFPTKVEDLARSLQFSDVTLSALVNFVQQIDPEQPRIVGFKETENPHPQLDDTTFTALRGYAQQIGTEQPKLVSLKESRNPHPRYDEAAFAALREYAQQIGVNQPNSAGASGLKVAEAGSLLEFLQERGAAKPSSTPSAPPSQLRTTVPRRDRAVIDATYVGEKVCMGCHASHAAEFGKTLMGRIASTKKTLSCETCHGPGSAHVKAGGGRGVGGIISFRPNDPSRTTEENNAICLSCHERGDRTYWKGSIHETRDVACTNCHTIMKNVSLKKQLKTAFEPETCFQCHKDRRAQVVRSSHMPIREGKITCTNCHNPHGSFTEALLRKNSINDTCYQCHAEKRGPFLFEHAPVRESCVNCHEPHGTANEYSLKLSRSRLCAECHAVGHGLPSGPQAVQTIGRQCQNCHTAVHGTNHPSGALLHR